MITEDTLQQYLDGNVSKEQSKEIKEALATDNELRKRFRQLKLVDDLLRGQTLKAPTAQFNRKVMEGLSHQIATPTPQWKKNLFIAIAVALIGFVSAIVLLNNYALGEVFSTDITSITFKNETIDLSPAPIGYQDLFFKGMIYLNGILGLFLLERAVLRPFFRWRRQQWSF